MQYIGSFCVLTYSVPKNDIDFLLQLCIIMKFYEGSVGDKMARLKGGKLLLPDVLRWVRIR